MVALLTATSIANAGIIEFPYFFIGENVEVEYLSPLMKKRYEATMLRIKYPDAYDMYALEEIDDFSAFGFMLWDVEQGKMTLEEFLKKLQKHLER